MFETILKVAMVVISVALVFYVYYKVENQMILLMH